MKQWAMAIGLIVVLIVLGTMISGGKRREALREEARQTERAAASAPKEYVEDDCAAVANAFSVHSKLTDLQKNKLWREAYAGRWVRWTVAVNTVDEAMLGGGYQLQFKCSPRSLVMDGHADLGADQGERLLKISKGDQVQIEGRLKDHGDFLGLSLDGARLLP